MPETRNSHRRDKYVITHEHFPLIRYTWQELIEEYTDIELNSEKKSEKVVLTSETAKQMTAELNQKFTKPLSETEVSCAVKSPQKKTYHYSKVRFLADLCINEDEQQLYAEMTEYREEKRKKAREKKIQRNQKIIELKAQDMTQKAIAKQVGCNPDTVGAVLREYNENGRVKRDKQIIKMYQKGMKSSDNCKIIKSLTFGIKYVII